MLFELWCWRRLMRVPWPARRSNQSILKEISPEYSFEGLMLKLNLQYFGHLMWRTDSLEKTLMLGNIDGRRRRGWQGWDGWMASLTQWTWVCVNSRSWWWTGKPGMLQSMGSQSRTQLSNWTELNWCGILVPWPGIKPTSPALEGRFLTTGPPGKSLSWFSSWLHLSFSLLIHSFILSFYIDWIPTEDSGKITDDLEKITQGVLSGEEKNGMWTDNYNKEWWVPEVFIRKYETTEIPLIVIIVGFQINISSCFPESLSVRKYLLYFIFHTRFTEACSMTSFVVWMEVIAAAAAAMSLQSCPTLVTPWTAAYQAPPSMGFSRQKYWSGVPLLSLGSNCSGLQTLTSKLQLKLKHTFQWTCLMSVIYV